MRTGLAWLLLAAGCSFAPSGPGGGATPTDGGGGGSSHTFGEAGVPDAAAASDAAPAIDAPVAPALSCPSGPGWFQIADSESWYFASTSYRTWRAAETACEALQTAGGSAVHLAVAETLVEVVDLAVHDPATSYWIGMFQPTDQATPDAGWLWITGSAGFGSGSAWSSGEPNDDGGLFSQTGESNDENFGELYGDGASLNDEAETNFDRYLCECDGVPVPAATRARIPH